MAPDSSLRRHHLGRSAAGLNLFVKVAVICSISVLLATLQATAGTEEREFPGSLVSLTPSLGIPKKEVPLPAVIQPNVSDKVTEAPQVPGRNRIQIPINEPLIQKYIRFYQGAGRTTLASALIKARDHVPRMTEILESYGVPGELVWIVFVESRFERHASYKGAGGYWQLMAATARGLGLRVNSWVDERKDPIKSTKAAAKYLRQLYERYDSWLLALSAYNTGGGPILSVVKKHYGKDWELNGHRFLPARCKVYSAKVLAAMHIMRGPAEYGFESPQYCKPKDFDPVMVKSPLRLEVIAEWIGVPVNQLLDLNPSLCLNTMPPDSGFALRLPSGTREKFELAYSMHTRR